jgi:hypothetical protein
VVGVELYSLDDGGVMSNDFWKDYEPEPTRPAPVTKDEALDLALEALEGIHPGNMTPMAEEYWNKAITAIKQARSAPVQEPVAWRFTGIAGFKRFVTDAQYKAFSPEVRAWYEPFKCASCTTPPAAPVQDLPFGVGGGLVAIKTLLSRDPCVHANTAIEMIDAILKEHPAAQRQFVGLTDDEFENIELGCRSTPFGKIEAMRKVETKLKEKNT